jgi:hypothetical protein
MENNIICVLASVVLAFEDGFLNDTIAVSVNGKQVYFKQKVTTKRVIGLASSVNINCIQEGTVTIDIEVPSRKISKHFSLDLSHNLYLAISIQDSKLVHRISDEPLGYM